jgi:ligand-binding sensor domain-containing protein
VTVRSLRVSAVLAALSVGVMTWSSCAVSGAGGGTGSGTGSGSSGPLGGFGRRDERQRIGSFSNVQAVAVSRRYVFAAGSSGIAIYDRVMNSWLPPLTRDDGLNDQQITVLAGDPVEDALWLGVPGGVIMYRPLTEQLQRTIVTGVPDVIAFDRGGAGGALGSAMGGGTGDAIVRAGGEWTRISRVGIAMPMMRPPTASSLILPRTLNDLYTQFPTLRTQPSLLLRSQQSDRPLRTVQIISGAASPERASEVWLGTAGDGLFRLDPAFMQSTPLPYGLMEPGVGALALAADGVWAAGLGQAFDRGGLSFVASDLQRFRWIDGTISVPLVGVRGLSLVTRASRAWLGTDRGLVRVRLDGVQAMQSWGVLDGLPDERVLSVATRDDGVWAGTARGLVYVSDSSDTRNVRTRGVGVRLLDNMPVHALQFTGDTLWIGTEAGLMAIASPNGAAGGVVSRPVGNDPALRRAVRALAWSDTVLLAATDDAVLRLAPRGGVEPVRVDLLDVRQVGRVTKVAIDDRTMWLAGTDGVVIVSRRDGATRVLRVPGDLPGPVLDIAMNRDYLWLGTPQGLIRLRRRGDGGLP